MTIRHSFAVFFAAFALWISAGCSRDGGAVTPDETSDSLYQDAQAFKRQGRNSEALSAYLRVIDRRGEHGAPLSHLEAGTLYLNWTKDPFEAYHHFSKYLHLQPNGAAADIVRGQRDAAMRAAAIRLNAPPAGQMVQWQASEELDRLRRRVQELEAELQTIRGASTIPVLRSPPVIALPDESEALTEPQAVAQNAEPATLDSPFMRSLQAAQPVGEPHSQTAPAWRSQHSSSSQQPASVVRSAVAGERVVPVPPTRPGAVQRPAASAATRGSHTVSAGEKSLWGIARRYYGQRVTSAQVQGIYEANRDVMRSDGDLREGMVLRIP